MENIASEIFNTSKLWSVLDLWYILVPIAFFLVFASRYVERVAISLFGFILGGYVLFPILIERIEVFREWALTNETNYWISLIIVGVFAAIALYLLYKIFVFLVGFLTSGAIAYFVVDTVFKNFDLLSKVGTFVQENWFAILVGFSALVGVVGGLFAVKKSSMVVAFLGMVCGSFILALQAVGWVYYLIAKDKGKTVEAFSSPATLAVLVVLTTVILILSLARQRKTNKSKESISRD